MTTLAPLTEAEIKTFVDDWYKKLDVHAPVGELLPMLADAGLEMRFPESTLRSLDEFTGWYNGVTRKFFDEEHHLKELRIDTGADEAAVELVVLWRAHTWDPPAAQSVRLAFDAAQRWIVQRSPTTNQPMISTYIVDGLTPVEGSPPL